jgi:hypothetical protein
MVVSSSSALPAPSVKLLPGNRPKTSEAFGRLKPTLAKLNEAGMSASDRVHVCEIIVIPAFPADRTIPQHSPDRLPCADSADISPATPTSALSRIDHGD